MTRREMLALKDEVERLRKKCDAQTAVYFTQQKELEEAKNCRVDINKITLENMEPDSPEYIEPAKDANSFTEICNLFYQVVSVGLKNNSFVPNRRITERSKGYLQIKNSTFKEYIEACTSKYKPLDLIKLWANMGFVYQDEVGSVQQSYVENGITVRGFRVKKTAVELVKGYMVNDQDIYQ